MVSNNPTFEFWFLDDFKDLENLSEMVVAISVASKDQQSESATGGKNRFANFIQGGFGKNTINNQTIKQDKEKRSQ